MVSPMTHVTYSGFHRDYGHWHGCACCWLVRYECECPARIAFQMSRPHDHFSVSEQFGTKPIRFRCHVRFICRHCSLGFLGRHAKVRSIFGIISLHTECRVNRLAKIQKVGLSTSGGRYGHSQKRSHLRHLTLRDRSAKGWF